MTVHAVVTAFNQDNIEYGKTRIDGKRYNSDTAKLVVTELGTETTLENLLQAMDSDTEADLMMYIARCWDIDVSDLDIQED